MPATSHCFSNHYCTSFFCGEQEKFCIFCRFFKNFFNGIENKCGHTADTMPKSTEYRAQQSPGGLLPDKSAQEKTDAVAKPDIPPADGKAVVDPHPK